MSGCSSMFRGTGLCRWQFCTTVCRGMHCSKGLRGVLPRIAMQACPPTCLPSILQARTLARTHVMRPHAHTCTCTHGSTASPKIFPDSTSTLLRVAREVTANVRETSPTDVYTFTHMHTHAQPRAHTLMYMCGAMHTHLGVHRYVHALIDTHDVCIHAHARSHSHLHLLICMHMDAHACARTHAQSRTCTQMPQTCTHARTCTNMLAHIHLQV